MVCRSVTWVTVWLIFWFIGIKKGLRTFVCKPLCYARD
ncbi:hypothetical protein TREVI0001_1885 [Treponema vincentii ATCC 35580]|uniref:Uncharacterized protein n=1 Tax=Treponema vincentii ATCC 35580 TaxID=596324 RepID=C8PPE2_9SPIR|nr:hypothetical protein TREVI0001_1885 [Treponema vincentii ATCC 35580]